MKRNKQQRDWIANVLALPAFKRAQHFLELVREHSAHPQEGSTEVARVAAVYQHVGALTVEAQVVILGLPEALIGLRILADMDVQQAREIAEELATQARQGASGTRDLDDTWIREAIEICKRAWEDPPLRMYTPATDFYKSVQYFSGITTDFKLKDVHGIVYPDVDSLDSIFRQIDSVCRQLGGDAILAWRLSCARAERKMPYELLANYGAKHIRRLQNSNGNALARLDALVTQFMHLMRFDHPACMGALWAEPAFLVEEIARTILYTRLCDAPKWRRSADLEFAEYLVQRHGTVSGWDAAKILFGLGAVPGTDVGRIDLPNAWIHLEPDPNPGYGESLRSALSGNLVSKPVIDKGRGSRIIAPRTAMTDFTGEIRRRLNLTPDVLAVAFEHFLRGKLSRLGAVVHGDYYIVGGKDKLGDIDAMIQTANGCALVVFECKAMAEAMPNWSGGYHATLEYLRRVFLKSQEQLLRFEMYLRKEGTLEVVQGGQRKPLTLGSAKIYSLSTSLRTFGELHRPGYSGALLSHFCSVQVTTSPSSRLGDEIACHQAKIQQHLRDLGPDRERRMRETLFVDLSLMDGLIASSDSAENLVERLERSLSRQMLISRVIPTEPDLA
ncbi:MAG: hypothetical protein K1X67_18805 [Fimbriimonadaceae bacterium]|nr:hypothetical protein [Fimbriimonadaceae bacterium]